MTFRLDVSLQLEILLTAYTIDHEAEVADSTLLTRSAASADYFETHHWMTSMV